mgnify:CR=1 FL=1
MEKYKEKIEKEAEKVMMNYLTGNNPDGDFIHSTIGADDNKNWWIAGYNACLNSKISERIKIDFALSVLDDVLKLKESDNLYSEIENKITELKKQIDGK